MQIRLEPMTRESFERWRPAGFADYARNRVKAGNWAAADAEARADREYEALLPQREATPGHFLLDIFDAGSGVDVGMIWVSLTAEDFPVAFLYNVEIWPERRGFGYGEAAIRAVERLVADRGATQLDLQVFGFNTGAQALYRRLDYDVSNLVMSKRLSPLPRRS